MPDLSEEELEKMMERKIEEKKEELKKEAKEEAREEIRQEIMSARKGTDNKEKVSRRSFLKKLGAGAIGLGALSLSPAASQLKLTKDGISKNGNQAFLGLSGSSSLGSDLDLSGYSITDSSQGFIDLTGDGNDLRLATGQFIEDGGGTERLEFNSNVTRLFGENGRERLSLNDSTRLDLHALNGSPVQVIDEEGGFTGVQYNTSSSAPGTLELTNANLSANGNIIENIGGKTDANSGDIRLAYGSTIKWRNNADNADHGIAAGTVLSNETFKIETAPEESVPVQMSSPNDSNVGTGQIASRNMYFMAVDDSANDAVLYINDNSGNKGALNLGSYSTKRLKRDISAYNKSQSLSVEAKTFLKGSTNSREQLGFIAEDFHDAGLHYAVEYTPVEDAWDKNEPCPKCGSDKVNSVADSYECGECSHEWVGETTLTDKYRTKYETKIDYYGEGKIACVPDGIKTDSIVAILWERVKELEKQVSS